MISEDFIHPEDAKALRILQNIPGFPALVKKVMELGLERLQYGLNMATAIRFSRIASLFRNPSLDVRPFWN